MNQASTSSPHIVDQALSTLGTQAITKQYDAVTLLQALTSCQRLVEHQRQSAHTLQQLMCTLFWQLLETQFQQLDPSVQPKVKADLLQIREPLFASTDVAVHVKKMLNFRSLDANPMASTMGQTMQNNTKKLLQNTFNQWMEQMSDKNGVSLSEQSAPPNPASRVLKP